MREARRLVGLRAVEVASELGVHGETVCRWEKGISPISRLVSEAFERLVSDSDRVAVIKKGRKRWSRAAKSGLYN